MIFHEVLQLHLICHFIVSKWTGRFDGDWVNPSQNRTENHLN